MKMLVIILLALFAASLAAVGYGRYRWASGTQALRAQLEAGRTAAKPGRFDPAELAGLPAPVRRYFEQVLALDSPMIEAADLRQIGAMNMGEREARWLPFTSTQRVITQRRGFDWDARIAMIPGVPGIAVYVHDSYVGGIGILRGALIGLVPVAAMQGEGEIARGELMRYLAEAVWYPSALLPSQGVRWTAVDDRRARATVTDSGVTVNLEFGFDDAGLIESVYADSRGRTVGDKIEQTPWRGRFWDYAERDGIRIPLQGEVAWVLAGGPNPYWRGRIQAIAYERAR